MEHQTQETRSNNGNNGKKGLSKKNKIIIGAVSAGVVVIAGVTFALTQGGDKQAKSKDSDSRYSEILKEKKFKVNVQGDFATVTGDGLTSEDVAVITGELTSKKDVKTVYWVLKDTKEEPESFSDNLLSVGYVKGKKINTETYTRVKNVEKKANVLKNWKVNGDKSKTEDSVLNIAVEIDGEYEAKDVIAEAKNIGELTDNLNEKKAYTDKVLNFDGKIDYQYTFSHPETLITMEEFSF